MTSAAEVPDHRPRVLLLACGALAREVLDVVALNQLDNVTVDCLPASYHMTPSVIPEEIRTRVHMRRDDYDRILVGYGDCGTGGALDKVIEEEGLERIPGEHCYQWYAGMDAFLANHDDDPTVFYLTDYMVKHFDRIVIAMLGLDRHPELRDAYFGNYTKVLYMSQVDDPALVVRAQACADRLGLAFEHLHTGYGDLENEIVSYVAATESKVELTTRGTR